MTREQKIRLARELKAQGLKAGEIAERIGANESTVRNWYLGGDCEHCGAPVDGSCANKSRLCDDCNRTKHTERNELLQRMWEAGEPAWYIAEQLGMTEGAVTSWVDRERRCRGQNLGLRKLGGTPRERRARHLQMVELRRKGYSNEEIAAMCGYRSKHCVSQAFTAMRAKGWKVPGVA